MLYSVNDITWEEIIIYLRKSRSDSPDETVEEVLAKHEEMLQEYAEKEFGHRIPEDRIFREVVSGETIDERPVMNQVMAEMESPKVKAVLTVDPQRLSRGDLEDCGRIVNAFRYSKTMVFTLQMNFDLSNKMDRKFFEQELMRGNDYLEYIKETLLRGRIRSVKAGNYIGNTAPFGFDKAEIDGCPSLKENADGEAVRLIFDMYVNQGMTYYKIGQHLDSIGVKPMKGEIWEKSSVRFILQNPHYAGYVRFGFKKTAKVMEDQKVVKKRGIPADPEEVIIAKGKHDPIVSKELFEAAQEIMDNNPKAKVGYPLQNPFAGILVCKKCGKMMAQHPYKHAKTRIECRQRKYGCDTRSTFLDDVVSAVSYTLEHEQLPMLEVQLKNNAGASANIQKKQLEALNVELDELIKQEDRQFELLEKGIYSEDVFKKRNTELYRKIEGTKSKIFELKKSVPKEINYEEKIIKLKDAIEALNDDEISNEAKNKLLKAIVERIEYEYLRSEGKGKTVYKLHIFLLL